MAALSRALAGRAAGAGHVTHKGPTMVEFLAVLAILIIWWVMRGAGR